MGANSTRNPPTVMDYHAVIGHGKSVATLASCIVEPLERMKGKKIEEREKDSLFRDQVNQSFQLKFHITTRCQLPNASPRTVRFGHERYNMT